jgi:hypothetical protein
VSGVKRDWLGGTVAASGMRRESGSRQAAQHSRQIVFSAAALLFVWSATYLARQSGLDLQTPVSPLGNFAVEGMILALAWLASVVAVCVATLTGLVVVRTPVEPVTHSATTLRPAEQPVRYGA